MLVFIRDEPTSIIDVDAKTEVPALMATLAEQGMAIMAAAAGQTIAAA